MSHAAYNYFWFHNQHCHRNKREVAMARARKCHLPVIEAVARF